MIHSRSIRWVGVVIGLTAVAAGGYWWWAARSVRWNVVLITLDTTRADHLGCYGHTSAVTPNLDRFASRSVLFERAYTVVPITLPAHATMLTGLLPPEHGLRINGVSRLPDSIPTLAEILHQQQYRTGAFVSSLVLDARFGLSRGFERFDDRMGTGPDGPLPERAANDTVSSALSWLESIGAEPFFCWVHLYDPHEPYLDHPDEFGNQFEGRPYDAEIAYMDRHVGRLLDSLSQMGRDDRTLIIIAGDHGEGLAEHQEATHGYLTYNSTMHVPLMIRHPAWNGDGSRVADPVSLVDLFPTILAGLRLEPPSRFSGRSLQALCNAGSLDLRPCYGESEAPLMEGGWCPLRTWTTDRWKFIRSTQSELYDLQADPHELHNLIDEQPAAAVQLSRELAEFESNLAISQGTTTVLSEQEQRALASLGYTGGHVVAQQDDQPRRDIKETLMYAEQVHHCMHLIDHNEHAEAREILEGVIDALPDYSKAWGTLGVCLAQQKEYAAAEEHFRKALELDADQNFARIGLGRTLYSQGKLEECAEQLEIATILEPSALDAQYYLGEASLKLGRTDAARKAFQAALAISPGFTAAEVGLADVAREEGRFDEAAARYTGILSEDPTSAAAALGWARLLVTRGREAEAVQVFDELLRQSPNHVDSLLELAQLLATTQNPKLRDVSRSIELSERACELTNRREVAPLRALAAAYAADDRLKDAIQITEAALQLARDSDSESLVAAIQQELEDLIARRESVRTGGSSR